MNSYAKVNIFLKITGLRDNYHEIASRFILLKNLYDEIYFVKGSFSEPIIDGNFSCDTKSNLIYKVYLSLKQKVSNLNIDNFFNTYKIVVTKNIPEFAGLGGGSSNAATFLKMINQELQLNLSTDEMIQISQNIGSDIAFFITGYNSANVFGIGEIIEEVKDDNIPNITTFTPPQIKCNTAQIYKTYRDNYYNKVANDDISTLINMKSNDILNNYTIEYLNDLYIPATLNHNELKKYNNGEYYFSGSGSSFFKRIQFEG